MRLHQCMLPVIGWCIACAPQPRSEPPSGAVIAAPNRAVPAASSPAMPAPDAPTGWILRGDPPEDYLAVRDTNVHHTGAASGRLSARTANAAGFGTLMQLVQIGSYAGRRVRLRAQVRTRDVRQAQLWLRVDGPGMILAFDNMQDRLLSGTSEWSEHVIVLDVPARAVGMRFGAILGGQGELWLDDVVVEVVGNDVLPTKTNAPPAIATAADSTTMAARYAASATAPRNLGFEDR